MSHDNNVNISKMSLECHIIIMWLIRMSHDSNVTKDNVW